MSNYEYLALLLFWSACIWPEEAEVLLAEYQIRLIVFIANCRLNWLKWRLHRIRVKLGKEMGWPDAEPFQLERFIGHKDL